jgi:hypothetical protein
MRPHRAIAHGAAFSDSLSTQIPAERVNRAKENVMVRFYCDRCNAEVDGPDDLVEVSVESRDRPTLAAWSARSEMCRSCYESVREAMTTLLGSKDEAKQKPVRRASS